MDLAGIWEGTFDGTNWGRLIAKLNQSGKEIRGTAEIIDIGIGTYTFNVKGSRTSQTAVISLWPAPNSLQDFPGTIQMNVSAATETLVRGHWSSSFGTSGTFRAEKQSSVKPNIIDVAAAKEEANAAFIMMAFNDSAATSLTVEDIYNAIKRGSESAGIRAHRADDVEHSGLVNSVTIDHIKRNRFLICDLTHERPNVYYELGFAHGLQKEVVLTALTGSNIHFDIAGYNIILYRNLTDLERKLSRRIEARIKNTEIIE
jgi:hypothetical protein